MDEAKTQGIEQGREAGREEGRQESTIESILTLLGTRFHPDAVQALKPTRP
jgi:predicted transposase YdaD